MLFTDGPFVLANDLNVIDGEFNEVAADESVTVDTSATSLITQAVAEAGAQFISRIQNFSGYLVGIGAGSNHVAAVLNVLSTAINRPRVFLPQVPVVEPDPTRTVMKRWVQFFVLRNFYRSLYMRSLQDRYGKKHEMYEAETRAQWQRLKDAGFPVILTPLSAPGATLIYNSGTWSASNLTAVAGGTQIGTVQYDVSVTWCSLPAYVNSANQANAESAGSQIATISVPANEVIQVSIATLNPPNGQMANAVGTAQGVYSPMAATHWNVYAGTHGGTLYLQNATPIPVATTSYTFTDVPVTSGFAQNAGQAAQYDFSVQDGMLWRA